MAGELTPKQYAKKLREFDGALPAVYAATINRVASAVHSESTKNIKRMFHTRNKYSEGSMRFYQAKPQKNADRINAITGTVSTYLNQQETGGIARNKDGSAEMSMPSAKARSKQYNTKPVVSRYRQNRVGKVAFVKNGKWVNRGAEYFLLMPGTGGLGLNTRKTTKKWRTWNAGSKKRRPPRKHWEYKLTEPTIFGRIGGTGKLIRVRRILKQPIHLKGTHWQTGASARFGKAAVINAAFAVEAEKALKKIKASDLG